MLRHDGYGWNNLQCVTYRHSQLLLLLDIADEWKHETACTVSKTVNKLDPKLHMP